MSEYIQAAMFDVMRKYFDGELNDEKWKYSLLDETTFLTGLGGLESRIGKLKIMVLVKNRHTLIYSYPLLQVPEEKRAAVCEFITRANYGLPGSNFEMDWNDGELRLKVFLNQITLTRSENDAERTLYGALYGSARIWERYGDNLMALLEDGTSDKSVSELIAECESA
jgi:hypothetical protein